MTSVLIHGFLGLPTDWQEIPADQKINLWMEVSPQIHTSLALAGEQLAKTVTGDQVTLVGYSLGGRIALHWPQEQWHRVRHMILISAHGGLSSFDEKLTRLVADQKWSEKFLKQEWPSLIKEWNAQAVFQADTVRPFRMEKSFSREVLASALVNWSLGQQEDQIEKLRQAPFPVTYVYGTQDSKFANYAKELQKRGLSWNFLALKGGHSLHLSHTHELATMMQGASLSNPLAQS